MRLYQCSVIAALSSVALASFSCNPVKEGITWNLKELQGPYSVTTGEDSYPTVSYRITVYVMIITEGWVTDFLLCVIDNEYYLDNQSVRTYTEE